MTRAFVGLGSNVGRREAHLAAARAALAARGAGNIRSSRVRETEPFGVQDQPRFLNQALELQWEGGARELLAAAKAVETELGRIPTYRWGPREIDVDLILFGSQLLDEPGLRIPHPGLRSRTFVLEPLLDLDPELVDPATGERLSAILAAILKR